MFRDGSCFAGRLFWGPVWEPCFRTDQGLRFRTSLAKRESSGLAQAPRRGGSDPARPWNDRWAVGIKAFELAPSGRAVCFICTRPIGRNSWRFDYRLRDSRTLSDQRRVHFDCVGHLPLRTREVDIGALQDFLAQPGSSQDRAEHLQIALCLLQCPAPAASSRGV